jgi:phage/plasmid-associated DNA primase
LPKDYLDQLLPDERAVLKKCGIPLDTKKIIEMPDERFNALINADHQELSDDDHNTWLKLSYELKIGIDEIKKNKARVREVVKQASQQQSKVELDESIFSDVLEGGKDNHWNFDGNGSRNDINEKPDFEDTLISKYHFKTLTDTKVILYYDRNSGLFVENGHIIIESEAEKRGYNNKQVAETLGHIQRRTYTNRSEFDPDIEWIGSNNCMINVKTGETAAFSPRFMNTTRIPVTNNKDLIPAYEGNPVRSFFKMVENWNSQKIIENSPCPAIMKFLYDIMSPEDVEVILDFLAYCLWREYKFNVWILLNGAGQNGKSTLLKLIARFLGRWNISSESLDRLLNNRFLRLIFTKN